LLLLASGTATLLAEKANGTDGRVLDTPVDRVLVYSNQAIITRRGEFTMAADRERLLIPELPASLADDSVRVHLEGDANPRMVNLEVILVHKSTFLKKEAQQASEELEKLLKEAKALTDQIQELKQEADFFHSIEVGALPQGKEESEEPMPLHLEGWCSILDGVKGVLTRISKNRLKVEDSLDELNGQIIVVRSRANRLLSYETESTKSVALEVVGTKGRGVKAEVSYRIRGPQWFPRYSVRADLKTGRMEIVMDALVRQSTGEDWAQAQLEFSAAEPSQSADLPRLMAWHIGTAGTRGGGERGARAARPGRRLAAASRTIPIPEAELSREAYLKLNEAVQRSNLPRLATGTRAVDHTDISGTSVGTPRRKKKPSSKGRRELEVERKLQKVERLWVQQGEALKRGDVASNRYLNTAIVQQFGKDQEVRKALGDLLNQADANIGKADRLLVARKLAAGVVSPVTSSGGYDYKYRASQRESVPSDGVFSKVTLGTESDEASFVYEIVPEKAKRAYLFGTMKNPYRSPLLAGPAGIFLGNDFVALGRVGTTSSGEDLKIGLGVDEGIVVSRTMGIKRDTIGWSGNRYSFRHEVEIKVRNNRKREVKVSVSDRVPFTGRKEVKIKIERLLPLPSQEKRHGLKEWAFDLADGEEKTIQMTYVVSHSNRYRVVLGDGSAGNQPPANMPDIQPEDNRSSKPRK
jgi:hypothetical protein